MIKVDTYPHTFQLSGETIELNKSGIRWIRVTGIENRMNLEGNIIGVAAFPGNDEYVIVIDDPVIKGKFMISKQNGWFGPFAEVNDVTFDHARNVSLVHGMLDGKEGAFPLVR